MPANNLLQDYGARKNEMLNGFSTDPPHPDTVGPRSAAERGETPVSCSATPKAPCSQPECADVACTPFSPSLTIATVQAPHARGNLSILLNAICVACKFVDSAVRRVRWCCKPICACLCPDCSHILNVYAMCQTIQGHTRSFSSVMCLHSAGWAVRPAWPRWHRQHPGKLDLQHRNLLCCGLPMQSLTLHALNPKLCSGAAPNMYTCGREKTRRSWT